MVPHRDVQVTWGGEEVTLLVHPYDVVSLISYGCQDHLLLALL